MLEFEVSELVVGALLDAPGTVDVVVWVPLHHVAAAPGAPEQRRRAGGPPDVAVNGRRTGFGTRQAKPGVLGVLL